MGASSDVEALQVTANNREAQVHRNPRTPQYNALVIRASIEHRACSVLARVCFSGVQHVKGGDPI